MSIGESNVSLWKILPLFLFAVVALFGYRLCNGISDVRPDARKTSINGITGSLSPVISSANSTEIAKDAAARTMAALAGLTARSSAEDLVRALNLNIINFHEGSWVIPADQRDVLKKSAEAIKAAPAGTKLEIGCHTDGGGSATDNLKLSEARAAAIKSFLVEQGVNANNLTSRGYGGTRPIARNDTTEGRFKNCRVEFSIVK